MLRVCDAADRAIDDPVSRSSGGVPPKHVQFARLCVIPPNSPSTRSLMISRHREPARWA